MPKQTHPPILVGLAALMALSLVLSGCGAIGAAKQVVDTAKELATKAPDVVKELQPGAAATAEPTAPAEATAKLENSFDNLIKLAPVHMSSAWVSKVGDEVRSSMSYEADVDANGNQHIKLLSNDEPVEIITADGKMYFKVDDDQFVAMGESQEGFSFLAVYGGAYLLAFNDLQEAKLLGKEAVGPWQANKYEIKMDLASLGAGGIIGGLQGAQWDYKGTAWVEPESGALVKAVVDWSAKGTGDDETESWHSEFLASKGTVTEITAPENVVSFEG